MDSWVEGAKGASATTFAMGEDIDLSARTYYRKAEGGEWTLVIVRPLSIEGGSSLKSGGGANIAFAVWQGGKGEVGARKCVTMQWTPVVIM